MSKSTSSFQESLKWTFYATSYNLSINGSNICAEAPFRETPPQMTNQFVDIDSSGFIVTYLANLWFRSGVQGHLFVNKL